MSLKLSNSYLDHTLNSALAPSDMFLVQGFNIIEVMKQIKSTLHYFANQVEVTNQLQWLELDDCSTLLQPHLLLFALLILFCAEIVNGYLLLPSCKLLARIEMIEINEAKEFIDFL